MQFKPTKVKLEKRENKNILNQKEKDGSIKRNSRKSF